MTFEPSSAARNRVHDYLQREYCQSLRGIIDIGSCLSMCTIELNHRLDISRMADIVAAETEYVPEIATNGDDIPVRLTVRDPNEQRAGLDRIAAFYRTRRLNLRTGVPIAEDGSFMTAESKLYLTLIASYTRSRRNTTAFTPWIRAVT